MTAGMAEAAVPATVGQLFTPTGSCSGNFTDIQTGVASGSSYSVPFNGFIVSWSFMDGAVPVTNLKFKVARPAGGGAFKIVGEDFAGTQVPNTVNTYPVTIQVAAGDLIGIHAGPGGLKVAKKRLRKANCALGRARGRGNVVKGQSAKPGRCFRRAQVNLKLG